MPDPITVWEVDLVRGRMGEREGVLILETERLVFRPMAEGAAERHLPLRKVRRVKRLLASPVLIVHHGEGASAIETAYYFVEPPTLPTAAEAPSGRFGSSRRKARRNAVQKLTGSNSGLRGLIREWEREVREAAARAAGGQPGG